MEKVIESEGKVSGLVYTPLAISTLRVKSVRLKTGCPSMIHALVVGFLLFKQ